jgi:hypothetical protein
MAPALRGASVLEVPIADGRMLNWLARLDERCNSGADLNADAGALHREDCLARSAVGSIFTDSAITMQIVDVDAIEAFLEVVAHRWVREPIQPRVVGDIREDATVLAVLGNPTLGDAEKSHTEFVQALTIRCWQALKLTPIGVAEIALFVYLRNACVAVIGRIAAA